MRYLLSCLFTAIVAILSACTNVADPQADCGFIRFVVPTPSDTVKSYKIIVHKDVPANRVGLILDAAYEWVVATSGKVVFEATYGDFDAKEVPKDGELRIYTGPKQDPSQVYIGFAWGWGSDDNGHSNKSRIWIQDDLIARTYYLTAMHEIGHAIGLSHLDKNNGPTIMFPSITDVGDHPTCVDRKKSCEIWGCDPGC